MGKSATQVSLSPSKSGLSAHVSNKLHIWAETPILFMPCVMSCLLHHKWEEWKRAMAQWEGGILKGNPDSHGWLAPKPLAMQQAWFLNMTSLPPATRQFVLSLRASKLRQAVIRSWVWTKQRGLSQEWNAQHQDQRENEVKSSGPQCYLISDVCTFSPETDKDSSLITGHKENINRWLSYAKNNTEVLHSNPDKKETQLWEKHTPGGL